MKKVNKRVVRAAGSKVRYKHRVLVISVLVTLFAISATGISLAYVLTQKGPITNTFTPPSNGIYVDEAFDGEIKKDVHFTNSGDYPVYVRAKVLITWKTEDGSVHMKTPEEQVDYSVSSPIGSSDGWTYGGDGFYYYTSPVPAGDSTENLIERITASSAGCEIDGETYYLSVEVLTQSIQANPADSVVSAWKSGVVSVIPGGILEIKQ